MSKPKGPPMMLHRLGALLMVALIGCSGTPRVVRHVAAEPGVGRETRQYDLSVPTSRDVADAPVEVSASDFRKALKSLARDLRPSNRPQEMARQQYPREREVEFAAEVVDGRVVRMVPLEEARPPTPEEAQMTREYLGWCAHAHGGGDCLGLLRDGPVLRGEDRYAVALALALGSVLDETRQALGEMVSPQAVLATLLWSAVMYLMLWALPEPLSKGLAAILTVSLMAWLGADAVKGLLGGWVHLVEEADKATTFAELRTAGEKYGRTLGQNTARALVLLVAAALGGSATHLAKKLPRLPGFNQAAAQAEAQEGLRLGAVAEVESVSTSSEGTLSVLMRNAEAESAAATAEAGSATSVIIRHQGGNRQVIIRDQRWHVPAGKSLKQIPETDPVGDQLQAAALQAAERWSPRTLEGGEKEAIKVALNQGKPWLARLLERQARGRFVERTLRQQFRQLRWSRTGADAVNPATGHAYEVLSGTPSNFALHGQRMPDELFRMIFF